MTLLEVNIKDFPKHHHYLAKSRYLKKVPLVEAFIIKPKPKTKGPSYSKLEFTKENKEAIHIIIQTMAENSVVGLLPKKKELTELGNSISNVHPLKFIETMFSSEEMKGCVIEIFKSSFKRNQLMGGLSGNLTVKSKMNDLDIYIEDFAKAISVPKEELIAFFESKDWEGLVRYLMNRQA